MNRTASFSSASRRTGCRWRSSIFCFETASRPEAPRRAPQPLLSSPRKRGSRRAPIAKRSSVIHNDATPKIAIDPETYDVRADGELLICEPAEMLPMAQRCFLF